MTSAERSVQREEWTRGVREVGTGPAQETREGRGRVLFNLQTLG